MSFPNIPDINPEINISLEDAINLLLSSIALEEISLSELIDAETEKIMFVLEKCMHNDSQLHHAVEINKSVNETIKNIIKLQMLLQFKLENVTDLLPRTTTTSTSTTTTTSTSTTTTKTTSRTTTCTTTTCRYVVIKDCGCRLTGRAKGCISNQSDRFNGGTASIDAFIMALTHIIYRKLHYSACRDNRELSLHAFANSMKIECPSGCNRFVLTVKGRGVITENTLDGSKLAERGDFVLKVWNLKSGVKGFRIVITSNSRPELNHDSGIVMVSKSCLKIE